MFHVERQFMLLSETLFTYVITKVRKDFETTKYFNTFF